MGCISSTAGDHTGTGQKCLLHKLRLEAIAFSLGAHQLHVSGPAFLPVTFAAAEALDDVWVSRNDGLLDPVLTKGHPTGLVLRLLEGLLLDSLNYQDCRLSGPQVFGDTLWNDCNPQALETMEHSEHPFYLVQAALLIPSTFKNKSVGNTHCSVPLILVTAFTAFTCFHPLPLSLPRKVPVTCPTYK